MRKIERRPQHRAEPNQRPVVPDIPQRNPGRQQAEQGIQPPQAATLPTLPLNESTRSPAPMLTQGNASHPAPTGANHAPSAQAAASPASPP